MITSKISPSQKSTPVTCKTSNSKGYTITQVPINNLKSNQTTVIPNPTVNRNVNNASHNWPWNSSNTNNLSNNNISNNTNNNIGSNKLKRISTNGNDIVTITKRVRTTSAENKRNVNKNLDEDLMMQIQPQSKITGFFKSQMKPLNNLKKEINNVVLNSINNSAGLNNASGTTISKIPSSNSSSTNKTIGLQKYFNIQASSTPKSKALNEIIDARNKNITTTTVAPSLVTHNKKSDKKTAKVAPISRNKQLNLNTPKKPITIAPRVKIPTTIQSNDIKVGQTLTQSQATQQILAAQQPAVVLAAIRIPNLDQQGTVMTSTTNTLNNKLGPIYQLTMPNLVQIQNKLFNRQSGTLAGVTQAQQSPAQHNGQFYMNGTVIKLQQLNGNDKMQTQAQPTIVPFGNNSTPLTANSSITQTIVGQGNGAPNTKLNYQHHQVFMTTPGIILNTALPTVSYHTHCQTNSGLPALQPITSNVLPSISTILPNHQGMQLNGNFTTTTAQPPKLAINNFTTSSAIQHQTQTHTQLTLQQQQQQINLQNHILSSSSVSYTAATSTNSVIPMVPPPTEPPKLVPVSTNLSVDTSLSLIENEKSMEISINLCSPSSPSSQSQSLPQSTQNTTMPNNNSNNENSNSNIDNLNMNNDKSSNSYSDNSNMNSGIDISFNSGCVTRESSIYNNDNNFDSDNNLNESSSSSNGSTNISNNDVSNINIKTDIESTSNSLSISTSVLTTSTSITTNCLPSPKSLILEKIQQKSSLLPLLSPNSSLKSPTVETEFQSNNLPESAKSPILCQPKTIRFPAKCEVVRIGTKIIRKSSDGRVTGMCYWDNCTEKYDSNSKLLDHLQVSHITTQTGPFACLWSGCKVYGKESCSKQWLERHVPTIHGGTKPFKCIFAGCGLRFGSHVSSFFYNFSKYINNIFFFL